MRNCNSPEGRKVADLLELVAERHPLSHGQQKRLERASSTFRASPRKPNRASARRRFVAVEEVVKILLEILEGSAK